LQKLESMALVGYHVNPALNSLGGFDGVGSVTVIWH